MIVYPAVDLINGKCVRLTKGDFSTMQIYPDDPQIVLNEFAQNGAKWVHMVDLESAKQGKLIQKELIKDLVANSKLNIQLGGGVRNIEDIETLFNYGVKRVILGSICISKQDEVKQWLNIFGNDKIVLALDVSVKEDGSPVLKTHGWQTESQTIIWDLLKFYDNAKYVLCTDIGVDGTLAGASLNLYEEFQNRFPDLNLIASGGVGSIDDLAKLTQLKIHGAVVGKAIYEGKIPLNQIKFY